MNMIKTVLTAIFMSHVIAKVPLSPPGNQDLDHSVHPSSPSKFNTALGNNEVMNVAIGQAAEPTTSDPPMSTPDSSVGESPIPTTPLPSPLSSAGENPPTPGFEVTHETIPTGEPSVFQALSSKSPTPLSTIPTSSSPRFASVVEASKTYPRVGQATLTPTATPDVPSLPQQLSYHSTVAIIGVVIGVLFLLIIPFAGRWWYRRRRPNSAWKEIDTQVDRRW